MIGQDLRYAVRLMRQQPGFTGIALLTLALGIGATTAIFSVVNAVVLRPLAFPRSDRLVALFEKNVQRGWMTFNVAPANFVDWARESRSFEAMVATGSGTAALVTGGEAEQVPATFGTAELFAVLGSAPALGRVFVTGDDAPGAAPVAVIGHGLWRRRFGGDPGVVGRSVTINDRPVTIAGVMPRGFGQGSPDTDLWLPITIDRSRAERGGRTLRVIARLADTASVESARTEMETLASRLAQRYPAENGEWGVNLVRLEDVVVGQGVRRALYVLLAAVGFVLLIACVNVANLLSARGLARHRELAIRVALGASRWRLIRQLLTESLLLAGLGGALGVFLSVWGTEVLLAIAPAAIPRLHEVSINGRVLTISAMVTLAAAIVFGLAPALQASAPRPGEALKETVRVAGNTARRRLGQIFVVVEVALAVVLLVGAGLLLRSFARMWNQPIGFEPEHALVFTVSLPDARYPSPEAVSAFHRQLLDAIRAAPGVTAVGATHALPFSGRDSVRPFIREGESLNASLAPTAEYRIITPGYFAAMGIPIRQGREFTHADAAGQPGAIVVSEAFARQFLKGNPIGQRIRQGGDSPAIPWLTVVGVAGDVRHFGLASEIQPEMFWPEAQATWGPTLNRHRRLLTFVVRGNGDPAALLATVRTHVAAIDPNRPLVDARPMSDLIARSADAARFSTLLLTLFAALGLLLSAAGVYGVMAYTVSAHQREMGIRLALGAKPGTLLAQVLRSGMALAAIGGTTGLAAAWLLGDLLQAQLFKTAPHDPLTFVSSTVVLLLVALLACYVPARRASRVNPIEALRD